MKKFVMPLATFALAIGGAFLTTSMGKAPENISVVQGYIHTGNPLQPCELSIECETTSGDFCTVGADNTRVWGMDGNQCPVELFKIQ
ncbi:hypothetical protein GN157_12915 [Flavobacterium rakeshii]|uniref:Secreted protein n=1 Tax=Flavobacterium rakeshii TaxID=1038845 RepID=A0A6N8HG03_9FLAO|nr:DUF6520 family protein [Flavobacterium rakeshii]MUV04611.1 hypothetical protein [Flavobacterium rakeshii]